MHPNPLAGQALDGEAGASRFFGDVVEPACDSFDPAAQRGIERLLAAVLAGHAGSDVDGADLLHARAAAVAGHTPVPRPDLCVLPSRVTIGADVAITAGILGVVRMAWPATRIALVGSRRTLAPVVAGQEGAFVWDHRYPRHGALADRIAVWRDASAELAAWTRRHPGARVLVLDPDSRITQLGLLSLGASTRLFDSRSVTGAGSLTELATDWARRVTGLAATAPLPARVIPAPDHLDWGRAVVARLAARHGRPVVVVSLGVGGNPRKAGGVADEIAVLRRIAEHATVVLDSGGTAAETSRAVGVAAAVTDGPAAELAVGALPGDVAGPVVLREGTLPAVTGLLAAADLYAGYDSAFQHLAAAVGTPAVAVFVDPPAPVFVDRWCAPGATPVVVRRTAGAPAAVAMVADTVIGSLPARGDRGRARSARRMPLGMP